MTFRQLDADARHRVLAILDHHSEGVCQYRCVRGAPVGELARVAIAVGIGAGPAGPDHRQADIRHPRSRVAEQPLVAVGSAGSCLSRALRAYRARAGGARAPLRVLQGGRVLGLSRMLRLPSLRALRDPCFELCERERGVSHSADDRVGFVRAVWRFDPVVAVASEALDQAEEAAALVPVRQRVVADDPLAEHGSFVDRARVQFGSIEACLRRAERGLGERDDAASAQVARRARRGSLPRSAGSRRARGTRREGR